MTMVWFAFFLALLWSLFLQRRGENMKPKKHSRHIHKSHLFKGNAECYPCGGVEMKICTANITNVTLQKLNFRKMSYEGQHIS